MAIRAEATKECPADASAAAPALAAPAAMQVEISDHQAGMLLGAAREKFEAAYGRARRREQSPWRRLDWQRDQVLRAVFDKRPAQQLKIFQEAGELFERWATDPPTTRQLEDAEAALAAARQAGAHVRSLGGGFNAIAFLSALRGRGLVVKFDVDEDHIVVSPAVGLNETDRRQLAAHRDEIVAALTSTETF